MKCIKALLDQRDIADSNLAGLAERLNTLPEYCSIHPDQETVLIVSSSSKEGTVRVQSICCLDFQNRLVELGLISQ